jgi:hypothetical protein
LVCKPGFTGNYTLRFSGIENFDNNYCAMLNDSVTGHWYNLRTDTVLNLNLDSSQAFAKRFKIYFNRTVEILKTNDVCAAPNSGKAIVKATSAQGIFTWKDSQQNILKVSASNVKFDTLQQLAIGKYTVDFVSTTSNFCGLGATTFEIKQAPAFSVNLTTNNNSNCIQANGSITAQPIGGKAPYQMHYSNGSTAPSIANLKEGKYLLSIQDDNNCKIDSFITILGPGRAYSDFSLSTDTLILGVNNTVQFMNHATPHIHRAWDFGDSTAIDTSFNANHSYSQVGIYYVRLKVWADSCDDVFMKKLVVLNPLNINSFNTLPSIRLFPNPTAHYLNIKNSTGISDVKVLDALGREMSIVLEKDKSIINVKDLAKGIYHLRIFDFKNQSIDATFVKE